MTMKTELTAIDNRRSGNGLSCRGARTALSAWFGDWRADRADEAVRAPVGSDCTALDVGCWMFDVRCFGSGRELIFSASEQKRQRTGALQKLRLVPCSGARASVLDCGSPLPLSERWRSRQKSERAFSLI